MCVGLYAKRNLDGVCIKFSGRERERERLRERKREGERQRAMYDLIQPPIYLSLCVNPFADLNNEACGWDGGE